MAESILIEALGVPIMLDLAGLTDAETSATRAAWRDAAAPGVRSRGDVLIRGEEAEDLSAATQISACVSLVVREPGDDSDLPHLLERLSQRVTLAAITARRGELWMLHAAGLALPDGRVIVLVGPSGRGKTTASRALGQNLGYVSDETVAMDADGRVYPYRKPLSIIEGGFPKVQRAPSDLALGALPDADLHLAAIVLLDRREDAGDEPVIETLDLGDALEELVAQTSYLPDLDRPLQRIAALIAPLGGVRRVTYREAESLAAIVDDLVAPVDAVVDVVEAVPGDLAPVAGAGGPAGSDARYTRFATADAVGLADPDRIAVMQRDESGAGTVTVLAGIAPALWRAASGVPIEVLVDAAVDAYGAPDDGSAADTVRAAVDELVAAGLLHEVSDPTWSVRDDVAWHDSGDRVLVLSLAQPDAVVEDLQGSAALIWRALGDGHVTTDEVVHRVASRAGMEAEVVRVDVETFLLDLERHHVLVRG